MKNFVPNGLKRVAQKLEKPIYLVGGAVRNFLLDLSEESTDYDICGDFDVSLFADEVGEKISSINRRLGTCQIKIDGICYEYTRFRSEQYRGGEHVPESISFHNDIGLDARRRDLTINSIYYNVLTDEITDVFDGKSDLDNKIIRIISESTLESDGLRILRAIRLAAQLGFSINLESEKIIKKNVHLLNDISNDRKREELEKILYADEKYGVADAHYRALCLMKEYNIFPYILPEIKALEGVVQNPKYHKYDVLEHTLLTVRYARSDVRLAALLHDVGKPSCLDDEGHMKGHNIASEQMAREILGPGRLNYSNRVIEEVSRLCYLHMFDLKGDTSDAKMRLFVAANFDIIDKLAELREADGLATGMQCCQKINRFMDFKNALLAENAPIKIRDLNIDGNTLKNLEIPPSKRSEVLRKLHRACIIEPRLNNFAWLSRQVANMDFSD